MTIKEIKDLGYANGWKETPEIVKECREKHKQRSRTIGNCLHEYYCDKCGYVYKVDSSG